MHSRTMMLHLHSCVRAITYIQINLFSLKNLINLSCRRYIYKCRYRIQQGSFDDFLIDNKTGLVTIGKKLDYDRRNTYQIEIVAADLGKPLDIYIPRV